MAAVAREGIRDGTRGQPLPTSVPAPASGRATGSGEQEACLLPAMIDQE
jgi:hypothetical protein